MKTIQVQIEDLEYDILESYLGVGKVEAWLQHAISNKCRQRTDASIVELTDRNPGKLRRAEKLALLEGVDLPVRKDLPKGVEQ